MNISSLERKLVLDNFRNEWPKERLKKLILSEYFMVGNKSTLAYCLEFGDARYLGSIKGGDSSKFGIYERKAESKGNRSFICYDERYSWKSKYGSSAEEAFSKIKNCLLETISLIEKQDLDAIEALDFEPALKWKIAFIYQNHDSPCILPIYSLPMLQKLSETPSLNSHSQAYKFLMENRGDYSALDYGVMLWQKVSVETKELDAYNERLQNNQAVQCINTLRNVILFGPPGTGKTYNTVTEALDIIEPDIAEYNSDGRGHLHYQFRELVKAQRIQFVTFHQSFSYEDFIEGIKAESQDGVLHYRVIDGLFKQICQRAEADPENPYVLIIDEINRGNISRIFGELITLLEPSKRLGAEEELKVVLPYSKQPFGVPGNLYLIGTMNTADRSLAGLDLALRRRFFFKEMPPRPDLLDSLYVEGIKVGELLRTINRRITALLGRDYCLGHALFMPLQKDPSLLHLGRIFQKQVLPLLQEYFFEDWQKIALVLNDHRKSRGDRFVTQDEDLDLQKLFGEEAELGNLPTGWKIKPEGDSVWSLAPAYAGII